MDDQDVMCLSLALTTLLCERLVTCIGVERNVRLVRVLACANLLIIAAVTLARYHGAPCR
jgi:hypothetical protein